MKICQVKASKTIQKNDPDLIQEVKCQVQTETRPRLSSASCPRQDSNIKQGQINGSNGATPEQHIPVQVQYNN